MEFAIKLCSMFCDKEEKSLIKCLRAKSNTTPTSTATTTQQHLCLSDRYLWLYNRIKTSPSTLMFRHWASAVFCVPRPRTLPTTTHHHHYTSTSKKEG